MLKLKCKTDTQRLEEFKRIGVGMMLKRVAYELFTELRERSPVDTRNLRQKIRPPVGDAFSQVINFDAAYSAYVIFGTSPHEIRPKRTKALHFIWRGKECFFKRVNHPGTRGNPFVDEAIEATREKFPQLALEVRDAIFS